MKTMNVIELLEEGWAKGIDLAAAIRMLDYEITTIQEGENMETLRDYMIGKPGTSVAFIKCMDGARRFVAVRRKQ